MKLYNSSKYGLGRWEITEIIFYCSFKSLPFEIILNEVFIHFISCHILSIPHIGYEVAYPACIIDDRPRLSCLRFVSGLPITKLLNNQLVL